MFVAIKITFKNIKKRKITWNLIGCFYLVSKQSVFHFLILCEEWFVCEEFICCLKIIFLKYFFSQSKKKKKTEANKRNCGCTKGLCRFVRARPRRVKCRIFFIPLKTEVENKTIETRPHIDVTSMSKRRQIPFSPFPPSSPGWWA